MSRNGTILFREKQLFQLKYARIALAMPPLALLILTLRQIVWHHPWGNPPASNGGMVFQTVLVLLVYIRLMTVRLVTELRPEQLSIAMKGLWRRTRIPLADIRSAAAVRYDAKLEYGGYGIRSGTAGRAYTASGDRGVQLELTDGRKILVGSQRPDELAQKIVEAQQRKP